MPGHHRSFTAAPPHRQLEHEVGASSRHTATRSAPSRRALAACAVALAALVLWAEEARAHTYSYTIETRGDVESNVERFAEIADEALSDIRGWTLNYNVRFTRVQSGEDFRLILASPEEVDRASPVCSPQWSCRVGDQVLINDERWRETTPTWPLSRYDYRRYVINHEVGHWLGLGHADCPGDGEEAPVMMQQSKGLEGCEARIWPKFWERNRVSQGRDVDGWPTPPESAPCTMTGTDGDDRLEGGRGPQVVCGGGGSDVLLGGPGYDLLRGGPGDDRLEGSWHDDILLGGGGGDTLAGGAGDDLARGGPGGDELLGSSGNDELRGETGADVVRGHAGRDFIGGGAEGDRLYGGGGADVVIGWAGADVVEGRKGPDRLEGKSGNDTLRGGGWADVVIGHRGDDTIHGGWGGDELRGRKGADEIRGHAGEDFTGGGSEVDRLFGGGDDDHLRGWAGDDLLDGRRGHDRCEGGSGDDTVRNCEE